MYCAVTATDAFCFIILLNDALAVVAPAMYVMKLRFMLLSLTEASSAGLLNIIAGSSSMIVMLSPPRAAAWALTGRRRKLYAVWLSCARLKSAKSVNRSEKTVFFI